MKPTSPCENCRWSSCWKPPLCV